MSRVLYGWNIQKTHKGSARVAWKPLNIGWIKKLQRKIVGILIYLLPSLSFYMIMEFRIILYHILEQNNVELFAELPDFLDLKLGNLP